MREFGVPPLPFLDDVGHAGHVVKPTFKCSTLSILPNLVVIADIVLKRKLLQTFSVITVQVPMVWTEMI